MLKQMGKFTKSYGRYVFFALLVIVCISFALTPGMVECNRQKVAGAVAGKMFKKDVPRAEYEDLRERWMACRKFLGVPKLHEMLSMLARPDQLKDERSRMMFGYYFPYITNDENVMNALAWRVMVYLHEAKAAGVQVIDSEVSDLVVDMFGGEKFDRDKYMNMIPDETKLSVSAFEETMREALILNRYFGLVQDAASVTTEDIFKKYQEEGKTIRVRSVKFEAKEFEAMVRSQRTRDAVKPASAEKRPIAIDGDSVLARYLFEKDKGGIEMIPAKVRMEYVFADYASFGKDLPPVTEVQILERYETERETYLIHTHDMRFKPLDEVKADVRKAMQDGVTDARVKEEYDRGKDAKYAGKTLDQVKEEIRKGLLDAITDDSVKAEYDKTKFMYQIKDEDKRYKPIEEVKEEIRKNLEKSAAAEKAIAKLGTVEDEINGKQLSGTDVKIDFEALAKAAGLTYGKTPLFDDKRMGRVEEILGKSDDLKKVLQSLANYSADAILAPIHTDKGSFVARILEKQDSFFPPLTEPLREKLAGDLRKDLAKQSAFHAAQALYAEWNKRIAGAKEEWGKAHPDAKADERDKAWETKRREVFEQLVAEKGLSPDEPHNEDVRALNALDIFEKARYDCALSPAARAPEAGEPKVYEDRYWVTQLMDRYEADGKDFDAKKPTIRDELARSKRGDFMANWLEAMWKEAGVKDSIHKKTNQPGEEPDAPDDN